MSKATLAGLGFRCQHPVGQLVVDFYSPFCKLVIEVNGEIHTQQTAYNEARTKSLQALMMTPSIDDDS